MKKLEPGCFDRITIAIAMCCILKFNEDENLTDIYIDPSLFSAVIGEKITVKRLYDSAVPLLDLPRMQYKTKEFEGWARIVACVSYTSKYVHIRILRESYDCFINEINLFINQINERKPND